MDTLEVSEEIPWQLNLHNKSKKKIFLVSIDAITTSQLARLNGQLQITCGSRDDEPSGRWDQIVV